MKTLQKLSAVALLVVLPVLLGCPRGHYRIRVDERIHDHDRNRDRDRDWGHHWDHRDHGRSHRHWFRFRTAPQASSHGVIIEVRAGTSYERIRVENLANSLNFTGQAMPGWWRIVVLTRPDWEDALKYYHLEGRTASAFTVLGQNETLISEDYMLWHGSEAVQFTLAHEAGHMICQCQSEDTANDIARILTKQR